ncbi:homocysteine S-methyltransferase [Flavilitoribacter nigricans]|uniref:S-methylmethionine:homocysteine methyltransferase n=1 Tax=Flavilitoribacter nigricans (strain ATCC 23147 / DSM 23189 / NBRC 102662 / NCIMB 1420 / SS-2) TaxID=1122177 RepID=A0A2D0N4L3_FLAN2|nr:homocysteine S-methyltransferase [Flavilitoribacter nigricans]PHN03328.1 homocysteine S-methyltransferase [Flavilitoribacter nigricans DSM 23189 = NBRC 102662]
MKNPFQPFLEQQGFVVLDGAMATELEAMGADLNDPLWSAKVLVEDPELIREVHLNYLTAGADVLSTATYQATYRGFARRGIDREAAENLFVESVRLAAAARAQFWMEERHNIASRNFPLIAASLGPYGAYLADGSEYHGNYGLSRSELEDWHRPQVETLAALEEVDLLLFETIPSLLEAEAIIDLMGNFPDRPYGLSFSCKNGRAVSHGETFMEALALASGVSQIAAVGINCTAPEFIGPLLETIKGEGSRPLMVYPNSGEVWNAGAHCWEDPENKQGIADHLSDWYHSGARIIGGCCRTTPADIARIRGNLQPLVKPL